MGSHSCGGRWPDTGPEPWTWTATGTATGTRGGRHAARAGRLERLDLGHGAAAFRLASATSWQRALTCALLSAGTTLMLVFQYRLRHAEAVTAAFVYNLVTPALAATKAPIVWFGLGRPGAFGLLITPDCSAVLLLVPLLLLGTALVLPVRLPLRRVLAALLAATGLLVAGNLVRIGAIAIAIRVAGPGPGYQIGHLVIGSAISVVCIGASLLLMTFIITSKPDRNDRAARARTPEDSRG